MSIVTGVIGLLGTSFTGYMAYKMAQLKVQSENAAEKVAAVALDLKTNEHTRNIKLDGIKTTTDKTLSHVNDQFLIQLRLYAESMRALAEVRKGPGDEEKAQAAERMYNDHREKQEQANAISAATDAVSAVAGAAMDRSKVTAISLEKHP